jgi:predicted molibdopterin-dependent oxidoreductase YjgC
VLGMLGGAQASWDELVASATPELKKLKGGWIVGGYTTAWLPKEQPALFKRGYRVVQDVLSSTLATSADVFLPAAAFAEKDGCWENYQGKVQAFAAAVPPPDGVKREGDVYLAVLGRSEPYNAASIRAEMGDVFAEVKLPTGKEEEPAFEFQEL